MRASVVVETVGAVVEVTVPDGSGASAIAQALYDAGVIESKSDFLNQVRRTNSELSLKSGTYSLMTGANVSDLVKQLVSGPNSSSAKLTVAEGLTLAKTAQTMAEAPLYVERRMRNRAALLVSDDQAFLGDPSLRIPQACDLSAVRLEVRPLLRGSQIQLTPHRRHVGRQVLRRLRC